MVASGDWLTPHYNYEPRFQKPVLYYWLTSATYLVTGPSEFGARLWAAIAGLGLVLVTAAAGRRWYDEATGLLAGAIVATSFGYFSIGRMALPDLPLTFCITLAIWAALVSTLEQERNPRKFVILAAVGSWTWLPDEGTGRAHHSPAGDRAGADDRAPLDRARAQRHPAWLRHHAGDRAAMVRGDVDHPRQRLPARLFHRRQLRALRDRALQRSAAVVVLPAGSGRRDVAVDAAGAGLARADHAVAARPPLDRHDRSAPADVGDPAARVLFAVGRQAAALRAAGAAAAGAAARVIDRRAHAGMARLRRGAVESATRAASGGRLAAERHVLRHPGGAALPRPTTVDQRAARLHDDRRGPWSQWPARS